MKLVRAALLPLLLTGCAVFDGGERTAAVTTAAQPAARAPFKPAFGPGTPVALMPCKKNVMKLSASCRSLNDRHDDAGGVAEDEAPVMFSDPPPATDSD